MATTPITINVDSTILANALSALSSKAGWTAQIDDGTGNLIANPQTKAQAAKQRLISLAMNDIQDYNNQQALQGVTSPASNLIS